MCLPSFGVSSSICSRVELSFIRTSTASLNCLVSDGWSKIPNMHRHCWIMSPCDSSSVLSYDSGNWCRTENVPLLMRILLLDPLLDHILRFHLPHVELSRNRHASHSLLHSPSRQVPRRGSPTLPHSFCPSSLNVNNSNCGTLPFSIIARLTSSAL